MQQLITTINKDLEESLALIADRYAPDFKISFFPGRYFVINSSLLFKFLASDPTLVNLLSDGVVAFDLVKRK